MITRKWQGKDGSVALLTDILSYHWGCRKQHLWGELKGSTEKQFSPSLTPTPGLLKIWTQWGSNFNMDETSKSSVLKWSKIISIRGKRQVGAVTSAERGTNTTGVYCLSATGRYIPPMLIFKRKRIADALKVGAPEGTAFACTESGWIDSDSFVEWLRHFIKLVKPTKENKHASPSPWWALITHQKSGCDQFSQREWNYHDVFSSSYYSSPAATGCGILKTW